MVDLIELDSPESNFVNPDEVIFDFLKEEQLQGHLKYIVSRNKKGITSTFDKMGLKLILPSKVESVKSTIRKSALNGFGLFIFSLSTVKEVVTFFSQSGYVMTEKTINISELPINDEDSNELLELVHSLNWKGTVIFPAHDGYPIYLMDLT